MIEKELTEKIIGAAIEVHRHWGPGLYEEIYERSLCHELRLRDLAFDNQLGLPLVYKGERVGDDLRVDLIVSGKVVMELKAVKKLEAIHEEYIIRVAGSKIRKRDWDTEFSVLIHSLLLLNNK